MKTKAKGYLVNLQTSELEIVNTMEEARQMILDVIDDEGMDSFAAHPVRVYEIEELDIVINKPEVVVKIVKR